MTAPDPRLGEIEARLAADWEASTSGGYIGDNQCMTDRAYLLAELRKAQDALGRLEGLADAWEARGEHDMKFSKAFGDEDIAMALLTGGAAMVENARHIRNAIRAAVAAATGGEDAQD